MNKVGKCKYIPQYGFLKDSRDGLDCHESSKRLRATVYNTMHFSKYEPGEKKTVAFGQSTVITPAWQQQQQPIRWSAFQMYSTGVNYKQDPSASKILPPPPRNSARKPTLPRNNAVDLLMSPLPNNLPRPLTPTVKWTMAERTRDLLSERTPSMDKLEKPLTPIKIQLQRPHTAFGDFSLPSKSIGSPSMLAASQLPTRCASAGRPLYRRPVIPADVATNSPLGMRTVTKPLTVPAQRRILCDRPVSAPAKKRKSKNSAKRPVSEKKKNLPLEYKERKKQQISSDFQVNSSNILAFKKICDLVNHILLVEAKVKNKEHWRYKYFENWLEMGREYRNAVNRLAYLEGKQP